MTFDRVVVILGVVVAIITALVPVAVAVIGKTTKPSKELVREIKEDDGAAFNITHDYVKHLKSRITVLETQVEDLDFENDILREALLLNGIPIPQILDKILNKE